MFSLPKLLRHILAYALAFGLLFGLIQLEGTFFNVVLAGVLGELVITILNRFVFKDEKK